MSAIFIHTMCTCNTRISSTAYFLDIGGHELLLLEDSWLVDEDCAFKPLRVVCRLPGVLSVDRAEYTLRVPSPPAPFAT